MRLRALGAAIAVTVTLAAAWAATVVFGQTNGGGIDVVAVAGQQFTAPVASFLGSAPPESFDAQIDWGDGSQLDDGTIAPQPACPYPDFACYEVRGTHTYASAGTYPIEVDIAGPDGGQSVTATATVSSPPGGPPPPPGPLAVPSGATAHILGPQRLNFTDPARFIARVQPAAVRHEWDLDGDGSFELDTGPSPAVDHGFAHAGSFRVGLRATLPGGGALTTTRDVVVQRPPVMGLDVVGASPGPRERVRLRLGIAKERGTRFELFAWRIRGVKPGTRALRLPGARGAPAQLVRLRGAQPTRKPTLVTSFPRKGSYPIVVTALDAEGHTTTLHTSVSVGGKFPSRALPEAPVNCDHDGVPGGFCPQLFVLSQPAAKVQTAFAFTAPSAKACIPKNATLEEAKTLGKLEDALDLPYPGPGQFGQLGVQTGAARAAVEVEQDCVEAEPQALRWEFGDGTTLQAPPGGSLPKIVSHVYGAPGTYKATLLARVPYFVQSSKIGKSKGLKASDLWDLRYKLSTRSVPVEVVEAHCGPLKLSGISVSSVPGSAGQFGIPDVGADGCFIPGKTLDGTKTLYKTFTGYDLDLNTVAVRSGSPSAADPDDTEIVDPGAAQIRAMPGESLQARFAVEVGNLSGSWKVFDGPALEVPSPKPDAELGGSVAALDPGFAIGTKFAGLGVKAVHVFLAPNRGALARLFLNPPPPLRGGTAPVVVGGGPKVLASAEQPAEQPDLTMDLSGLDLGLFEVGDFTLGHRPSGGWFGGGQLRVPALGFDFLAPYKPPPAGDTTSAQCSQIDGPSGISLASDGGFEYGGFTAKVPIPIPPVMELNCIAVYGQSEPFVMVGKVAGSLPPKGPFSVDGCFLMGILDAGQKAAGCGESVTSQQHLTWFRAAGGVKVHSVGLANGYVDVRKAADLLQVTAKGTLEYSVGIDVGPVNGSLGVEGSVKGALVFQPKFGFHLIGNVGLCVENPGPDVGCADIAKAGVSSKGFGACSWIASFVYHWNGGPDAWLGNCNLENEIGVTSAFVRPAVLGGPLMRSPKSLASRALRVPRGLPQVGFRVRGEGGAPIVTLSGPGGQRIVDDGTVVQRGRAFDVIHGAGETLVVVRRPRGGLWRVDARAGSSAIRRVGVSLPLREPRVRAAVTGRGRTRVLGYRARLARVDTLTFVEEGRAVTRQLGRARRGGRGQVRFSPGAGSPGLRTIYAVVERRGVVYKRFRVTSYRAPRAVRPSRPSEARLRLVRARGRVGWRQELLVSWRRARGARRYEVVARISDGRVLRMRTRRHAVRLPSVDRWLGVRLAVVAIGADGRRSGAARAATKAKRPRRIVTRL